MKIENKVHRNIPRKIIMGSLLIGSIALSVCWSAQAGSLRDRLVERRIEQLQKQGELELQDDQQALNLKLPPGAQVIRDVAYGDHARQKFDIYLPPDSPANKNRPVILMVHGGAWRIGSKTARGVVENKMAHWLAQGYIFISTNYRLVPDATPLQQAEDVAAALALAQSQAAQWGGDARQFILVGHSAGAHLVSQLAANPSLMQRAGAQAWLGTIALDIATYDISKLMSEKHYPLYDKAFGNDPALWRAMSPMATLSKNNVAQVGARHFLAVCSSTREEHPCQQAKQFVDYANSLGLDARVLPQALKHGEINDLLGKSNAYTDKVDQVIASWQPQLPR